MQLAMFAEFDWSQAFTGGLIGGGIALVIAALVFFFRAMTSNREESQQFEANQSVYMGSLVLGIALVIGGLYFKGSLGGGGIGDSSSMSNFSVFESKEGRFKASFPGKPKLKSQSVLGMTIKMYSVEEKDGIMGVAFIDLPTSNIKNSQADTLLTSARKGMLQNMGATLRKEDRITLHGKYPGREIKADVPSKNAEMYCSIYLVNGRAYQVLILGKADWLNSDKARKFLNSFSLK